jgi:hypothetical protein
VEPGPPIVGTILVAAWQIFAILFVGWDACTLLFVFWFETAVASAFNGARLVLAGGAGEDGSEEQAHAFLFKLVWVPHFFFLWTGINALFCEVIIDLFGSGLPPMTPVVRTAMALLVANYVYVLVEHVRRRAYRDEDFEDLAAFSTEPLLRSAIMLVAIFAAALLRQVAPRMFLVAVVLVKVRLDLRLGREWAARAVRWLRGQR